MSSAGDLAIHLSSVEQELAKDVSLLSALEDKFSSCTRDRDTLGIAFWGDRVSEKKKEVRSMEEVVRTGRREFSSINEELDGDAASVGARGMSLRLYAESEEREELMRLQETHDELAAWRAGNDIDNEAELFPPIETLLQPSPLSYRFTHHHRRHHGRFGHFGGPTPPFPPAHNHGYPGHHYPRHPDGFRTFIDRVSDVVQNPSAAASLVPTQEIKSMLENFLVNLSNQLAGTFDGAPPVAVNETANSAVYESEPVVPGAFVVPEAEPPTEPEANEPKLIKPGSKPGKGGFRHKHIFCDGCLTGIRGMRYKCEVSIALLTVSQWTDARSNALTTIFAVPVCRCSTPMNCIRPRTSSRR